MSGIWLDFASASCRHSSFHSTSSARTNDFSVTMTPPPEGHHRRGTIARCNEFLKRLSSLEEAMFNSLDNTDPTTTTTGLLLQHFTSNAAYRATFLEVVAADDFDFRSWRHHSILSQYLDLLYNSVCDDLWLLSDTAQTGHHDAMERWGSWEAVRERWPFEVPVETSYGDEVQRVCADMWAALGVVAAAALQEEARVGQCWFDVTAERGVVGRCRVDNGNGTEGLLGSVRRWFSGGKKMKQD